MRIRRALISAAAALAIGTASCAVSAAEKPFVYRIQLDDAVINPVAVEYVKTGIQKSVEDGAAALLIQLDTPGGLLTSTRKIVKAIMNARVPIIVYVAPSGARAGSAGVFITLAAHIAAMAPSTNIGAAHPVALKEKRDTGDTWRDLIKRFTDKKGDGKGAQEGDEKQADDVSDEDSASPMEEKILNDTEAWVRSIAGFRGRNEQWSVEAVSESVSATEAEALDMNVIDIVAPAARDVVAQANGRPAMLPGGTVKMQTEDARIVDLPMGFRLKWLNVLAHPNIAYILLMLGFYGLLFEFTHPGIGFPGIAGAICLVLAFFGLQVLPTNFAGIALIALAIALFIAEVNVTSYGLLTLGGIVSLFFGSLILFAAPYEFMRVSLPLVGAFVGATLVVVMGLAYLVVRSHRRQAKTGREGLVGAQGTVRSAADGRVKVFVHGELWDAECKDEVSTGDTVTVMDVHGTRMVVSKR